MDDLEQEHKESIKSDDDLASGLDLSLSVASLAENNSKTILLKALEINNITHETLNISISKFNKLSKPKIASILKDGIQNEENDISNADKSEAQNNNSIDIMGSFIELQTLITDAMNSKNTKDKYKKLDSNIGQKMLVALADSGAIKEDSFSSSNISKIIIGLGLIYFISRVVGFENIMNKVMNIKSKILNQKKDIKKDAEND